MKDERGFEYSILHNLSLILLSSLVLSIPLHLETDATSSSFNCDADFRYAT